MEQFYTGRICDIEYIYDCRVFIVSWLEVCYPVYSHCKMMLSPGSFQWLITGIKTNITTSISGVKKYDMDKGYYGGHRA